MPKFQELERRQKQRARRQNRLERRQAKNRQKSLPPATVHVVAEP